MRVEKEFEQDAYGCTASTAASSSETFFEPVLCSSWLQMTQYFDFYINWARVAQLAASLYGMPHGFLVKYLNAFLPSVPSLSYISDLRKTIAYSLTLLLVSHQNAHSIGPGVRKGHCISFEAP
jgi:hypothetical protein